MTPGADDAAAKGGAGEGGAAGGDAAKVTPDFAVPDAYKEKGWSKNLKSTDDVWKMLDNAQGLAGKKTVVPDFEKADPKEVDEYMTQLRPKDKGAYKLAEAIPEDERGGIVDILHEVGLPAPVANKLMDKLLAHVTGASQKMYDKEGFLGVLKASFGEGYEATAGSTAKLIAGLVNEKDKALLEHVPNEYLGLIYRISAGMAKSYGAKESGAGGEGGEGREGSGSPTDKSEERSRLRKEISALDKKAHTAEDRQKLVNQLNATYQ